MTEHQAKKMRSEAGSGALPHRDPQWLPTPGIQHIRHPRADLEERIRRRVRCAEAVTATQPAHRRRSQRSIEIDLRAHVRTCARACVRTCVRACARACVRGQRIVARAARVKTEQRWQPHSPPQPRSRPRDTLHHSATSEQHQRISVRDQSRRAKPGQARPGQARLGGGRRTNCGVVRC